MLYKIVKSFKMMKMDKGRSFYDFDYIIDLGEKRVEQYIGAYQSIMGRMTNIILVYSILGIYLVPIIQDFIQNPSFPLGIGLTLFVGMLTISIYFTIRLLIPVDITYFQMSSVYYQDLRIQYEHRILKPDMTGSEKKKAQESIDQLLKASYIDELIRSQSNNGTVLRRKGSFYFRALIWGLVAILPYAVCVGFHITRKVDTIQKVEIINHK